MWSTWSKMPRVFSSPVAGFSMNHFTGLRCSMTSNARRTNLSAFAKSRGLQVMACEYSVHGGAANTVWKCPGGMDLKSQSSTSTCKSAPHFGSASRVVTSNPWRR